MKHRILTTVITVPLLVVLTTTPAYAIFGSILAGIQRAADDYESRRPNLQRHDGEDHPGTAS